MKAKPIKNPQKQVKNPQKQVKNPEKQVKTLQKPEKTPSPDRPTPEPVLPNLLPIIHSLKIHEIRLNSPEAKKLLSDLQSYFTDPIKIHDFIIPNLFSLFQMIENQIFRSLPIGCISTEKIPVTDLGIGISADFIDPLWPHLEPVYNIAYKLVSCELIASKFLKPFISSGFFNELLGLFNSEEPKERAYLRSITQILYFKLVPKRKMLKNNIDNYLLTAIHESLKSNGLFELLEVVHKIIENFSIPLRIENVTYFNKIILPLHKIEYFSDFHPIYLNCVKLFISKEHSLAPDLIKVLLKYWPIGNSDKEILFISEIQEFIQLCEAKALTDLIGKVVRRLIRCITGMHIEVAQKVVRLFNDECFGEVMKKFKEITVPLIACAKIREVDSWNPNFFRFLDEIQEIARKIDEDLFDTSKNLNKVIKSRVMSEAKWDVVTTKAKVLNPNFQAPALKYTF